MTGDNVQHWDDVHDLPWGEAFAMASLPEPVEAPVRKRRRADSRSLADVVKRINSCPLVLLDVDLFTKTAA